MGRKARLSWDPQLDLDLDLLQTWRGQRSLATWDFYGKNLKKWQSGLIWDMVFMFLDVVNLGLILMPSFPQVNTWQGACHLTHLVICSRHIILLPISNPRAAARIVAHPHSTWGSESDVSDFTKTIKTSKKTAICFRSRPVMTRVSIEKWHRGPYSAPFWHEGQLKILKEPVTKPIWTIQIDFWEVYSICNIWLKAWEILRIMYFQSNSLSSIPEFPSK